MFGCSKRDPILPGIRHEIFDSNDIIVLNESLQLLSDAEKNIFGDADCNCHQDTTNTIWCDNKKIYSGFSGNTVVNSKQSPICVGDFVYTGLSNGSVVKINKHNKRLIWATDVYKENGFTGGSAVIDVIAHVGYDKGFVYAGGLGDAFCKINANNGDKVWCVNISVPVDFIMVDEFLFVVGGDNNLYSINTKNGDVYWKSEIKKQIKPKYYENKIIIGNQQINYVDGSTIK